MSNTENVSKWRKNLKRRALQLFDNKCVCCGYNKCSAALEFHHLEPEHKDFTLSSVYANPKSWDVVVKELEKCALVCANCHREIHYGDREIDNKSYINYAYVNYKLYETENYHTCYCGSLIHKKHKYCSHKCYNKARETINWSEEKENILKLKDVDNLSFVHIAKLYNSSDNTIRKWYYRFKSD